jgi:lipopolysaccharide transport system permease protein
MVTASVDPQRVDLLWTLVWRDLVLRYRRSVLGIAWSQIGPLALLGVLAFVFSKIVPLGIPHYALFVIVGLLAWTWFSAGLTAAIDSVVTARDLVRLPGFPAALLPAIAVTTHLMHFLLAVPVLLLIVGIVLHGLSVTVIALPLVIASQFLVTLAPAYLLAAANVRYRDVSHIVGVALLPLFYASPVFYDADRVPDRYRWIYDNNPIAILLDAYRNCVLFGRWPHWTSLGTVTVLAAAAVVASRRIYNRAAPDFAELL